MVNVLNGAIVNWLPVNSTIIFLLKSKIFFFHRWRIEFFRSDSNPGGRKPADCQSPFNGSRQVHMYPSKWSRIHFRFRYTIGSGPDSDHPASGRFESDPWSHCIPHLQGLLRQKCGFSGKKHFFTFKKFHYPFSAVSIGRLTAFYVVFFHWSIFQVDLPIETYIIAIVLLTLPKVQRENYDVSLMGRSTRRLTAFYVFFVPLEDVCVLQM